jgi:hypothetical protein
MASYNKQKLMRMDEQILNLEYLYERELLREKELSKHTLLLSRGFRFRLENLYKARQVFVKATGSKVTNEMNYAMTLAERQEAYDDACDELEHLRESHEKAAALVLIQKSDVASNNYLDLGREIIKQEARVRNKRRALDNWINKQGMLATQEKKLARSFDAEEEATAINERSEYMEQQNNTSKEDPKEKYNKYITNLQHQDKVENNATLDLLMRPEETEEVVEINPFLPTEPYKKPIIG